MWWHLQIGLSCPNSDYHDRHIVNRADCQVTSSDKHLSHGRIKKQQQQQQLTISSFTVLTQFSHIPKAFQHLVSRQAQYDYTQYDIVFVAQVE